MQKKRKLQHGILVELGEELISTLYTYGCENFIRQSAKDKESTVHSVIDTYVKANSGCRPEIRDANSDEYIDALSQIAAMWDIIQNHDKHFSRLTMQINSLTDQLIILTDLSRSLKCDPDEVEKSALEFKYRHEEYNRAVDRYYADINSIMTSLSDTMKHQEAVAAFANIIEDPCIMMLLIHIKNDLVRCAETVKKI